MGVGLDWLFDLLIAVLQEAKTWGPWEQILAVFGVICFVGSPGPAVWRWMKRRETDIVKNASITKRDLDVATAAKDKLAQENEALARFEPRTVLRKFEQERRDGQRSGLIATADEYMEHHRACFAEACRILAEHHLSRYEDGADALRRARAAVMGAMAADPSDKDSPFLLGEIEALQKVDAAPPRDPGGHQGGRGARAAPAAASQLSGRHRGTARHWPTRVRRRPLSEAALLWERALETVESEGLGVNSLLGLAVRIDLGYATLRAGRIAAARDIIVPLADHCERALDPTDTLNLSSCFLLSELRHNEGAYAEVERLSRGQNYFFCVACV